MRPLSPRDSQLASLIHRGLLNKEIAYEMGLSIGTIKAYVWRLFQKTGFRTRTEVAVWWEKQMKVPHRIEIGTTDPEDGPPAAA